MQKSAAISAPTSPTLTLQSLTPYVLWALMVAGLGELFLFRTLSRVGVHIPKQGLIMDAYELLTSVGSFAFNLATVLVFLALALLARSLLGEGRDRVLASVPLMIVVFALVSLVRGFVEETAVVSLTYGLAFLSVVLLLAVQLLSGGTADRVRKPIVVLIVAAYLGALYPPLANHAYRAFGLAATPPATAIALEVAEALVVVNALLIFWAWSGLRAGRRWRPSKWQLGVAACLAVIFLAAYYGRDSSTAAILSLWTLGLTLYLPLPFYVLALALYGATFIACLSDRTRAYEALALGLLPVAGLTLETTYQHLLAIVVLLLLGSGRLAVVAANDICFRGGGGPAAGDNAAPSGGSA